MRIIFQKKTGAVKTNVIPHEKANGCNFKLEEMIQKLLEKIAIIVNRIIFYSSALLGFADKLVTNNIRKTRSRCRYT